MTGRFCPQVVSASAAYTTLQLHTLIVSVGPIISLRLLHMACGISEREPLAEVKAAEDVFTRQLSSVDEGGAAAFASDMQHANFYCMNAFVKSWSPELDWGLAPPRQGAEDGG